MATISIILMRINWPNFSRCQISGGRNSPGYMSRIITVCIDPKNKYCAPATSVPAEYVFTRTAYITF